jgi:hypothetical protein
VRAIAPQRGAWLLAAGRAVLGTAVLASPEKLTAGWLGASHAHSPVVKYLARSLGVRDLALAIATLTTLEDPVVGPRVQAACAAVDSVDALATILARTELPIRGVIGTVAIAGAAAGAGFYFSHRLAHP